MAGRQARLRLHLLAFFEQMGLSEVTLESVQDYPVHRIEMIEKHYAALIKNTLDAATINVMRLKAVKGAKKAAQAAGNGMGKERGAQARPDEREGRALRMPIWRRGR